MPLAVNMWQMYELKQIIRQADSKLFAELLNRMRDGNQTSSDISTLNKHMISRDVKDFPYQHTHYSQQMPV